MKQTDINRAVAQATGESVRTIKSLGFQLEEPLDDIEPEIGDSGPNIIDWDALESERYRDPTGRPYHDLAVA